MVRKVLVAIIGGLVIIAGVGMIFFPGPAIVVIPLGFAILASEFAWAKRGWEKFSAWFLKVRTRAGVAWNRIRRKGRKVNVPG